MEPTPTAELDRSNDLVYDCTTKVVKAIMVLSEGTFNIYQYVKVKFNTALFTPEKYAILMLLFLFSCFIFTLF